MRQSYVGRSRGDAEPCWAEMGWLGWFEMTRCEKAEAEASGRPV
jgi:hypothetical protein